MNSELIQAKINTDFVRWLNSKTDLSNQRVVLVDGFCLILRKIQKQAKVKVSQDGYFHQRFWKSVDRTLNFKLLKSKKNNKNLFILYQFCFLVLKKEEFIIINNETAVITEKGKLFLLKEYHEQLDFLLRQIW